MAASHISLSDLKTGCCTRTIVTRLLTLILGSKECLEGGALMDVDKGGGHTPDDDMHGKRSASSKFNVGVSSGGNPAEGGEDPKEPSDAEETIASREQTEYNSETVYNVPPDSPEGESTERGSECKIL